MSSVSGTFSENDSPLSTLTPGSVWHYFEQISGIPRVSGTKTPVLEFLERFARSNRLSFSRDTAGNIVMRKPAHADASCKRTICLQSHCDMVGQKDPGTEHDFQNDPIHPRIEGEWVTAPATSLGADNGIGVAAMCAILSSPGIPHGPLEALFTVEEENTMEGAFNLSDDALRSEYLLNLDSESFGELFIGCAGGETTVMDLPCTRVTPFFDTQWYRVELFGATGGHSGIDIHRSRANAIQLLARILTYMSNFYGFSLSSIEGGDAHNAIPRNAAANIALAKASPAALASFKEGLKKMGAQIRQEYAATDPGLDISISPVEAESSVYDTRTTHAIINALNGCPNGVFRADCRNSDMVYTSSNIGIVEQRTTDIRTVTLQRSIREEEKQAAAASCASVFELAGAHTNIAGNYPGWAPDPDSVLTSQMKAIYTRTFSSEPVLKTIHAGLECGILKSKYPRMEMLSFGPTIIGAHSVDEKVHIESVAQFWEFLCKALQQLR